ncbi:MAG: hypothetical protein U0Q55_21305 [Vicinamibacterales bacterium]
MGDPLGTSPLRWCVAIFSARETARTLASTLDAARAAVSTHPATIDLIVNGNARLAEALAARVSRSGRGSAGVATRVWSLALRDKAHAWNAYVHDIWPGAGSPCFMDGCITVSAADLSALQARFEGSAQAMVAAAVPTAGRSAAAIRELMLRNPQIHGSLYAVRDTAMAQMRAAGFRLPLGFYRSDSLLGTLVNFNFDPATHEWDDRRIAVTREASWTMPLKSPWNPADVSAQLRRMTRQAVGRLEEAAIKELFYDRRTSIDVLTPQPLGLVDEWQRRVPDSPNRPLMRSLLARVRMAHLRRRTDWRRSSEPPACLVES